MGALPWFFAMFIKGNNFCDLTFTSLDEKALSNMSTVKTLNIGTARPATVVVLNIKQFNFTMK